MMALGENGDAVHIGALERGGEFAGVEIRSHARDVRRRMEVEMDLALMGDERVVHIEETEVRLRRSRNERPNLRIKIRRVGLSRMSSMNG